MSYKEGKKIPSGYPRTHLKIPGFLYIQNPGIFYSGIFQASKSRDYLVTGFFDPRISRDIPGPGYPVDIPSPNTERSNFCLKVPKFNNDFGKPGKNNFPKISVT